MVNDVGPLYFVPAPAHFPRLRQRLLFQIDTHTSLQSNSWELFLRSRRNAASATSDKFAQVVFLVTHQGPDFYKRQSVTVGATPDRQRSCSDTEIFGRLGICLEPRELLLLLHVFLLNRAG